MGFTCTHNTSVYVYTFVCVPLGGYVCVCTSVCGCLCMCILLCVFLCVYVYTFVCVCLCVYVQGLV